MARVLVAGVGSPHGADQLGWAVISALQAQVLPDGVEVLSCRQPAELTALLLTVPRAIVVDAMLGEGPAGRIHQFSLAELPQAGLSLSSHGLGLVEALQLALALGMPAERVQVLALDVGTVDTELDPAWVGALCTRVHGSLMS